MIQSKTDYEKIKRSRIATTKKLYTYNNGDRLYVGEIHKDKVDGNWYIKTTDIKPDINRLKMWLYGVASGIIISIGIIFMLLFRM